MTPKTITAPTTPKMTIHFQSPSLEAPLVKEFYTHSNPMSKHIRDIRLDGTVHNNKMERLNGEVRDREKVVRGLKRTDTPILKGYQIFHNYIRPHEALGGQTPADRCGIQVKGENKWLTIIQSASHQPRPNRRSDVRVASFSTGLWRDSL